MAAVSGPNTAGTVQTAGNRKPTGHTQTAAPENSTPAPTQAIRSTDSTTGSKVDITV